MLEWKAHLLTKLQEPGQWNSATPAGFGGSARDTACLGCPTTAPTEQWPSAAEVWVPTLDPKEPTPEPSHTQSWLIIPPSPPPQSIFKEERLELSCRALAYRGQTLSPSSRREKGKGRKEKTDRAFGAYAVCLLSSRASARTARREAHPSCPIVWSVSFPLLLTEVGPISKICLKSTWHCPSSENPGFEGPLQGIYKMFSFQWDFP